MNEGDRYSERGQTFASEYTFTVVPVHVASRIRVHAVVG